MRTCSNCDTKLDALARRDARYCSTRCRVAAHRAGRLPAELTSRDRWVRRDGKRPITVRGAAASVTNPRTWASYEAAKTSARGHGLGFVLGDGVGCIDLDHALVGGKPLPWAQKILDRCPSTYVEVSMSGNGLHVFGLLGPGPGRGQHGSDGVEWYSTGRYIAVTGDRFAGSTTRLADLAGVVATL
jgi:primase-polymerase (primpol)-like protein